jgi:hypothetical protein
MRETSANEPLTKHRKDSDGTKTRVSPVSWEKHGRGPTYCPCGVRCTDGVTLIRAFVWNLRTWPVMLREKVQVEAPRGRKYRSAGQGRTAS